MNTLFKIRIYILFLMLQVFSSAVYAEIIETSSLTPIQKAAEKADQQSLVIFDVDDVIIMPEDEIFKTVHKSAYKQYQQKLYQRFSVKKLDDLWGVVLTMRRSNMIDTNFITIMEKLKANKIKTIALTKCGTGKVGQIERLENWRLNDLASKGIDFSHSFPEIRTITFGKGIRERGDVPLHKKGIVFTAGKEKGPILRAFLKVAQFKPRSIIFVDDQRENLISVERLCQQWGIQFLGFHYTAAKAKPVTPLNEKRVKFQLATLTKHRIWLSDKEADRQMASS